MDTKEAKEIMAAAEEIIQFRDNNSKENLGEHECAACNSFVDYSGFYPKDEEWERNWEKGDLCYLCLRKWFHDVQPEKVSELAQEQIENNFARDEQIELGGERICRD